MIRREWIAIVALIVGGCVDSTVVHCASGSVCPTGLVCEDSHGGLCLLPGQLTSCDGLGSGDTCAIGANQTGTCTDGLCLGADCGDGIATSLEPCDGQDLHGKTSCEDLGFYEPGPIACELGCVFDTRGCTGGICGDSKVDSDDDEQCDAEALAGKTDCTDLSYYESSPLSCNALCRYNVTGCMGFCGDQITNGPELCDGAPPSETCVDQGFDAGPLACQRCGFDQTGCRRIGWRVMSTPFGIEPITLLAGSSSTDLWAVAKDEILHSTDGASWSVFATASMNPTALWVAGPGDFWIAGNGVDHRVGASSTTYGVPGGLHAIWGSGPSVFAGGENGLFRLSGSSFVAVAANKISAIGGTSPTDVWVAIKNDTAMAHYNGVTFGARLPVDSEMSHIVAFAPDDVFAAGSSDIIHWDGVSWTTLCGGCTSSTISSIAGSPALGLVATADDGTVWRIDPAFPTRAALIGVPGPEPQLPEVQAAVSWVLGTELVIAGDPRNSGPASYRFLGSASLVDPIASPVRALWGVGLDVFAATATGVRRFSGSGWGFGTGADYHDVWGTSPSDVYLVGGVSGVVGGFIDRHDGFATAPVAIPSGAALRAVWGIGSDVFAVGELGRILHRSAGSWSAETTPVTTTLRDVFGTAADDVYAVGDGGTIIHRNASGWSAVTTTISVDLRGIWGTSSTDIWIAGAAGTVAHWDGASWTTSVIATADLSDVHGFATDDVFVSGSGGALFHFDGERWAPVRPATSDRMSTIWGVGPWLYAGTDTGAGSVIRLFRATPW